MIKLNALRIAQNPSKGQAIYVSSVPVKYLVDKAFFDIHWWKKEHMGQKTQGYQRVPMESRLKKIAKYLDKNRNFLMPTSILVNSRDYNLEFKSKSGNIGEIHLEPYPCYVVDGQTRIEGFRYAIKEHGLKVEDFEMPVIFLSNFPLEGELEQFFVLNNTQKRVSTDLAQRLKMEIYKKDEKKFENLGIGELWELKALKVADLLNSDSKSSVWKGKIRLPNTIKSPINIISQNSFVKSLRPLYRGGLFENLQADAAFELLDNYWEALKVIFSQAFEKPNEYVIQKTAGVFSVHDLANNVFNLVMLQEKKPTKENILNVLVKAFDDKQSKSFFWHIDNRLGASSAGSMKGFSRLAEDFRTNLESIKVKI